MLEEEISSKQKVSFSTATINSGVTFAEASDINEYQVVKKLVVKHSFIIIGKDKKKHKSWLF